MLQQIQSNIQNKDLFNKEDTLLVGFSGGVDSVVLAHLLHRLGYRFALAHCHFNLRSEESDGDLAFCKQMAENLGVIFHSTRFETKAYAAEHGLSIQMAARELRYQWFRELVQHYGYDYVATAHHADDSIETFFVNLTRGSGINGLQGIKARQHKTVRPLLSIFKEDILAYARENNLPHREDSSNEEVKYKRNFIRHKIIPEFKRLNPAFGNTMLHNMSYLAESEKIVAEFCKARYESICEMQDDGTLWIHTAHLLKETHIKTLLYHWLHPMGFNPSQIENLLDMLTRNPVPGKYLQSASHTLAIDRGYIAVKPNSTPGEAQFYTISTLQDTAHLPVKLSIEALTEVSLNPVAHIAMLDADRVKFPLTLRRWQNGDRFKPLGMKGFKKLSDFFVHEKMNRFDKEQCWILESGGDIVWLVGRRIDDRFKLTESTKNILKITYL